MNRKRIAKSNKILVATTSNNIYTSIKEGIVRKYEYNVVVSQYKPTKKVNTAIETAGKLFKPLEKHANSVYFEEGNISVCGKRVCNVSKAYGIVSILNRQQARGIINTVKI